MFPPTLLLRRKAPEPNPNIYKYFWDLPGFESQKFWRSSRLDPLSINKSSWLECIWAPGKCGPQRGLLASRAVLAPTLSSCGQKWGKALHSKKKPKKHQKNKHQKNPTNFCYFVMLEDLWESQGIADTIWYILGVCHQELYLHSPSGRWAEPGGGRLGGFPSAALCGLRTLVPSSFQFMWVFLSPFLLILNISGVVSRNPFVPAYDWWVFLLRTWFYGTGESHLCKCNFRWAGTSTERLNGGHPRPAEHPRNLPWTSTSTHSHATRSNLPPFQAGLHKTKAKTQKSTVLNLTHHMASLGLGNWKNLHFQWGW